MKPNLTTPIVQVWPDRIVYRASAVGGCPRSLLAARTGMTPQPITDKFKGYFQRGHDAEDMVIAILKQNGWETVNHQCEVHIDLGPIAELKPVWILGHLDFDSNNGTEDRWITTEVKRFGKQYVQKFQKEDIYGFPTYCAQISTYLHARTERQWRFIIYQGTFDGAEDSFARLIIRDYEEPPYTRDQLREIVSNIELLVPKGTTPVGVPCTNNYPCPYIYLHDTPEQRELSAAHIATARAIKLLDRKIDQITKVKENLRSKLQNDLKSGKYKSPLGDVSITFADNPMRIDTAKVDEIMAAAGVSEDEYKSRKDGKVMRISVKEQKGTDAASS